MVTGISVNGMLTVTEVGRLLHVHCNTLRRWSNQGLITAYRIGPRGDRRFRPQDIAMLLSGEQRSGTPISDPSTPEETDAPSR